MMKYFIWREKTGFRLIVEMTYQDNELYLFDNQTELDSFIADKHHMTSVIYMAKHC